MIVRLVLALKSFIQHILDPLQPPLYAAFADDDDDDVLQQRKT
jgi:hypothetical protein